MFKHLQNCQSKVGVSFQRFLLLQFKHILLMDCLDKKFLSNRIPFFRDPGHIQQVYFIHKSLINFCSLVCSLSSIPIVSFYEFKVLVCSNLQKRGEISIHILPTTIVNEIFSEMDFVVRWFIFDSVKKVKRFSRTKSWDELQLVPAMFGWDQLIYVQSNLIDNFYCHFL